MPTRLVIPATAKPADQPYAPRRTVTWQQLAAEARCEIAHLGDQWCQDYGIDGLGIASPRETLAERAAREAEEFARGANRRTVEDRARDFIAANSLSRQYLDNAAPSQAQTVAQVKRNTRAVIALIRLALDDLDTIDGTG